MPHEVTSDAEIQACFAVMSALRPHLKANEFIHTVRLQQAEGYRLACHRADGEVVAVAGYRIGHNLHLGKHLYVDDLVTAPQARSGGHGRALLEWLCAQARDAGCAHIHLDSGTQREQAHKFYFREGFTVTSFHFNRALATIHAESSGDQSP